MKVVADDNFKVQQQQTVSSMVWYASIINKSSGVGSTYRRS